MDAFVLCVNVALLARRLVVLIVSKQCELSQACTTDDDDDDDDLLWLRPRLPSDNDIAGQPLI